MPFNLLSLDNVRLKLLDLSGRNRLLNFRHSPRRSLRAIDELPDQLFEALLDGKSLQFNAVPEPSRMELEKAGLIEEGSLFEDDAAKIVTAEQWAKYLGLVTDYELPRKETKAGAKKHSDNFIQTLLYPRQLEAAIRVIKTDSDTSLEDAGVNILYMAFGFLEWVEERSEKIFLSPLLLVPVTIERTRPIAGGTYAYEIAYSGDDVEMNLSLCEKLKREYEIILDEYDVENDSPELYFEKIKKTIRKKEKWHVKRQVTLSLFNFSKLLMYLDLDPKNWLKSFFDNHPILSQLFAENYEVSEESSIQFAPEYEIDKLSNLHENFPLVLDADSSQHSALIDAIEGKNLVIEGPPGTGKSQTISNLIAIALGKKKKILFVAEKMAALEVVKRNLDKVGLGDFCLELHSDKTNKQHMLDSIRERLGRRYKTEDISILEKEYEKIKSKLNETSEKLNTKFKVTNYTAHDILMQAVRFRKFYNPDDISFELKENYDQQQIEDMLRLLQNYHDYYLGIESQFEAGSSISSHPWAGVNNEDLPLGEFGVIKDQLTELLFISEKIVELLHVIENNFAIPFSGEYEETKELCGSFLSLPDLSQEEWGFYHMLKGVPHEILFEIASKHRLISESRIGLKKYFKKELSEFIENIPELYSTWCSVSSETNRTLLDFEKLQQLASQFAVVEKSTPTISNICLELGGIFKTSLSVNINDLKILKILLGVFQLSEQVFRLKDQKLFSTDPVFDEMEKELSSLRDISEKLNQEFILEEITDLQKLCSVREVLRNQGLFRWMSDEWRESKKYGLRLLQSTDNISGADLGEKIENVIRYFRKKEKFEKNQKYIDALGDLFKGLDTDIQRIVHIRNWYKDLCLLEQCGVDGASIKSSVLNLSVDEFINTQSTLRRTNEQILANLVGAIQNIGTLMYTTTLFSPDDDTNFSEATSEWREVKSKIDFLIIQISSQYNFKGETSCYDLYGRLDMVSKEYTKLKGLIGSYNLSTIVSDPFSSDSNSAVLQKVLDFITILEKAPPLLIEITRQKGNVQYCQSLKESLGILRAHNEKFLQSKNSFAQLVKLNEKKWLGIDTLKYGYVIDKVKKSLANPDAIYNWVDFLRARKILLDNNLDWFSLSVESGKITSSSLESTFYCALFDRLAKAVLKEHPSLNSLNGHSQERLQQEFRSLDEKLKILQRKVIAANASNHIVPRGARGRVVGEYTEKALLDHELSKQKRHQPIRKMLDRAGGAISALKPCYMMSPMSVSRYLKRGELFDLVIMDEASQIKPEDAIGAMARGKQVVIVGDSKQLPPTNFFSTDQTSDNPDDVSAVESGESILEVVSPFFQPSRRLRWHYRSKHESLITFSNNSFYDGDLIVFPSPASESDEFGIKFHKVKGTFLRGRNSKEARIVARGIAKHLKERKEESLGVVAMNKEQADLIRDEFELLLSSSDDLKDAYDKNLKRHGAESLFIKNLENVQGDERDVVFISFTYGPLQIGMPVPQRFGPINSPDGWRRLNVLFTRSKKRMHIFTSMSSGEIIVHGTSSRGVIALKNFLAFAETRDINVAHVDASFGGIESPFESEVVSALLAQNYSLETQVGVAGYKIDIAVRDPLKPGNYLLGVECDGATYHSAKSARDRDILRQKVLEGLNWKIYRIWSTDWFKNPALEINRLAERLAILKKESGNSSEQHDPYVLDLVDETLDHVEEELLSATGLSLPQQLKWLQEEVIDKKIPHAKAKKKFLRQEMINALVQTEPRSRAEFGEKIPSYLIAESDPAQLENFIQDTVDIISKNVAVSTAEEY